MSRTTTHDPICGMEVATSSEHRAERDGRTFYFCSEGCRDAFLQGHRGKYELVIIGGGPAGLTAAVYAATLRINAFVITANLGGQAIDSTKIKNYMGYDFITGPELSQKFKDQLIHSNYIDHLMTDIETVTRAEDGFEVTVADGRVFATQSVIVASGMSRRKLDVPGEEEFQRKGVFYGNVQDIAFVQDKDAAIIGGGNSAMQIAENLSSVARTVHIISKLPLRTIADAAEVDRLTQRGNLRTYEQFKVVAINGRDAVEGLIVRKPGEENRTLSVSGVFVAVGMQPNSSLVADMVELNDRGEIVIRPDCSTTTPGLFAAGDVTDAYGKRIIIAAGEGAKAALAVRQYLFARKKQRELK